MNENESAKLHSAIELLRSIAGVRQSTATKATIERTAEYADIAKAYRSTVLLRERTVGHFATLNPGWRILLELYILDAEEVDVAVSDVALFTNIASTTSLRYITLLSEEQYIERVPCAIDRRRHFLKLTSRARDKIEYFLDSLWSEIAQPARTPKGAGGGRNGLQDA